MLADLDRAARASSASKEKDALSKDADEDEQPHHGSLITQTQDAPPEELAEGPVHPHPPLHTDKDTLGIVNSHEHAKGVTWQELTQQKYTLLSALFASIAGLLFGTHLFLTRSVELFFLFALHAHKLLHLVPRNVYANQLYIVCILRTGLYRIPNL